MKFLVIENDARVRRMIRSIVADSGDTVYECSDGAQARANYAAYQPDWVLMDLMMPETDGITATRQIKSVFPDARIAIVTSYESANLREMARTAGACAYVLKENLLDLRSLINQHAGLHNRSK